MRIDQLLQYTKKKHMASADAHHIPRRSPCIASRRIEAVLREIGNLVASPEIKKLSQVGKNKNFWGKKAEQRLRDLDDEILLCCRFRSLDACEELKVCT